MSDTQPVSVSVSTDVEHLANAAALHITDLVCSAQQTSPDGYARLVLTGGTAGIATLAALAALDHAAAAQAESFPARHIDFSRVHLFFGDERHVDVTHPDSNEGQARQALLDKINVPEENIHGWGLGPDSDLDAAVARYQHTLERFAPRGCDVHLLGMGGEGHINSIFPGSPAARSEALCAAVLDSPKPPAQRGTLCFPAINSSAHVVFLIAGADKAEAVQHLVAGADRNLWPAAGARGRQGTQVFLTADAAAGVHVQ